MSKRKILMLAMALCMAAILVVGGTLAYFTDDEQATNTFTIGNVEIDIDEWTLTDDGWVPFEDDNFTLYPIDNVQGGTLYNKMVYTANVSDSEDDAYIRNIVLIEANANVTENATDCCFPGVHYFFHNAAEPQVSGTDGKTYYGSKEVNTTTETVEIGGKDYYVIVFHEAKERAIPYDAALYTLSSVWMDQDVTLEQAKGWGEDNKVDIIVYSQGIQATGLTHEEAMAELGEVTEANLQTWLDGEDFMNATWTTKTKAE